MFLLWVYILVSYILIKRWRWCPKKTIRDEQKDEFGYIFFLKSTSENHSFSWMIYISFLQIIFLYLHITPPRTVYLK